MDKNLKVGPKAEEKFENAASSIVLGGTRAFSHQITLQNGYFSGT